MAPFASLLNAQCSNALCLPLLVRGEQHRGKRADQISTRPLSQSLTLRVLLSRAHPTPRPPCACGRCPSSSSPPAARSLGSLHHSRGRASPAARRSLVRVRVRVSAGRVSAGRVSADRVSAGWASTSTPLGSLGSARTWISAGRLGPPTSGSPRVVLQVVLPEGTLASPLTLTATREEVPAPMSVAETWQAATW